MIPKIIHYCWFGGNPLPQLAQKCIKSWKKHCRNYEIIEWNEKSFDVSTAPLYVRQAYEAKKWAFVSDYVRIYTLKKYGGIYMDTDVEVVSDFKNLMSEKAFGGFEDETHIGTAVMACEKDFSLFDEFLDYYNNVNFINEDGSYNVKTNVEILTEICLANGLILEDTYQVIKGFALYPHDYFSPLRLGDKRPKKTKNTVTIHWFSGSWLDETHKKKIMDWVKIRNENEKKQKRKQRKRLRKKVTSRIKRILKIKS